MPSQALWFGSALLPTGWAERVRVTIAAGRIDALELGAPPQPGDERHAIAIPGLPNVHSHAFQRGLAGFTERRGPGADSFWTWRERMYGFLDRIGPEELEALTALAYVEMLEGGFTHVAEFHYVHHAGGAAAFADPAELGRRIVAAAAQTGLALTLLPVFYAHAGFGGQAPQPRQSRFICTPNSFARLLEASRRATEASADACTGLGIHSLRAATPDELAAVVPLAGAGPIHIHIAEQQREVDDCIAWCGQRPIEWLLAHQEVDARWCLVHATQATAAELAGIAAAGALVGLCPITEANLGDGIFDAPAYLGAGGRYGIGSDSNVLIDAAEELRTLEYSQRLGRRARNVLADAAGRSTGRALFDAALAGTRVLGPLPAGQGSGHSAAGIAPGGRADFVTLDAGHPALEAHVHDELLDGWIFGAGRSAIDCVWTAGIKRVRGGRHLERDPILARYRKALRELTHA